MGRNNSDRQGITRAAWGKGRREILLLKAEINDLLAKGATTGNIYKAFSDRLSISETTFRHYVAALRRAANPNSLPPLQKARPARSPDVGKADDGKETPSGGTFDYDPSASDEDLW